MILQTGGDYYQVYFDIKNTGDREGVEIPQLYLYEEVANVTRPLKALKGFKAVDLKPGDWKNVTFPIFFDDLALWSTKNQKTLQPGMFDIMVGSSSDDIRLKGKFKITQTVLGEKIPEHKTKQ
jgi:beta-glucosidase